MTTEALEGKLRDLLAAGDVAGATTAALQGFGPEILGYQRAVLRDDWAAQEAFSLWSEFVWKGIGGFRGDASFRTWAHKLAYTAVQRWLRDPFRRRGERLATTAMGQIVQQAYSTATAFLEHHGQRHLDSLRATLSAEEQTLLILRIDRQLPWKEIAQVLDLEPSSVPALRKRYERIKRRLRKLVDAQGLRRE